MTRLITNIELRESNPLTYLDANESRYQLRHSLGR